MSTTYNTSLSTTTSTQTCGIKTTKPLTNSLPNTTSVSYTELNEVDNNFGDNNRTSKYVSRDKLNNSHPKP